MPGDPSQSSAHPRSLTKAPGMAQRRGRGEVQEAAAFLRGSQGCPNMGCSHVSTSRQRGKRRAAK